MFCFLLAFAFFNLIQFFHVSLFFLVHFLDELVQFTVLHLLDFLKVFLLEVFVSSGLRIFLFPSFVCHHDVVFMVSEILKIELVLKVHFFGSSFFDKMRFNHCNSNSFNHSLPYFLKLSVFGKESFLRSMFP